jgi:hypothetical protein
LFGHYIIKLDLNKLFIYLNIKRDCDRNYFFCIVVQIITLLKGMVPPLVYRSWRHKGGVDV